MIKFQAWDGMKMWTDITGFECTRGTADGVFLDGDYHSISNIVIRRFTGLSDKNGSEVYEGDILQSRHSRPCFIEWSTFQWTRNVMTPKGKRNYYFHIEADFNEEQTRLDGYEVIGNVYENSDLLK